MSDPQNNQTPKNTLWTKNFTILTLGSVVSMLGNALSGFSMSLLVLDTTQSSFYYSIFIITYTLPQMVMPVLSGAILDRFSRRRTIYTLDFLTSALYLSAAIALGTGHLSYPVLLLCCFLLGSINSIYTVAYQSFYPMLITEGNFSKAYSISSVLETFAAVMVPISAFVYNMIGMVPLLSVNACGFFIAAVMETRIDAKEEYIAHRQQEGRASVGKLLQDTREGFRYLRGEKGLLMVGVYFTFVALSAGAASVITLPYFKATYENGEYLYMLVWGMSVVGRAIGGGILYRTRLKKQWKYALALAAYLITSLSEAVYLYFSIPVMMVLCFFNGLFGVVSYTIRTSSTQSYVPHERKGRFNGAFHTLSTVGTFLGELVAGALTVVIPQRLVLTIFLTANAAAALLFIGGNPKAVRQIYETNA